MTNRSVSVDKRRLKQEYMEQPIMQEESTSRNTPWLVSNIAFCNRGTTDWDGHRKEA